MRILFKNATILTLVKDDSTIKADLLVEDNRIKEIKPNIVFSNIDRVIDCTNKLLMPTFKNAHGHTAMNFARNVADNLPLERWLNEIIFPMETYFDVCPNDLYDLVKVGLLEYLSSGIGAIFEMYQYPKYYVKAFEDVGFRANVIIMGDEWADDPNFDYSIFKTKTEFVQYRFGIHAIFTQSDERLEKASKIVHKYHLPFYLHLAESIGESEYSLNKYKASPTKYLDSLGLFDYGGAGFHSIYLNDEDMEIYKKHHFEVVSCPCSNAKLNDGICPIEDYLKKGIRVSLGTDGVASNNSLNMFKEMYLASVLQKLKYNDPLKGNPLEILKAATVNPARLMGLDDADTIEVNKKADLILLDLNKINMHQSGPLSSALVYSGSKDLVYLTMINGKILYEDNKYYIDEDVNDLYARVNNIYKKINKHAKLS